MDDFKRKNSDDLKRKPKKGSHFNGDVYKTKRKRQMEFYDIEAPKEKNFNEILSDSNDIYADSTDIYSNSNNGFDLNSMSTKARKKRKNLALIAFNIVMACILVFSTGGYVIADMLDNKIINEGKFKDKEEEKFEDIITSGNSDVIYILVNGVDLNEKLTDIVMVACYDLKKQDMHILQIPRDTYVSGVPSNKFNAIYGSPREGESSVKALIRRINSEFGLPIDFYVTMTIKATEKIIDAIGGVEINLPRSYTLVDDSRKPEIRKYFEKGKQNLSGQWATALIRHRKSYAQGDMGRIKAQRSVYAAIMKKMLTLNMSQMTNIVRTCLGEVSTNFTYGQALGVAQKARGLSLKDVKIMAVPGQSLTYRGLSVYSVHKGSLLIMLNKYFRPYEEKELTLSDIAISELTSSYNTGYDEFLQGGSFDEFDYDSQGTTTKSQ